MNFSYVLDKEPYQRELSDSIDKLSNVVGSSHVAYMHGKSSLITDKVVTSLRYVQEQQGVTGIIEGMLLEACYKAELNGAGSADLCSTFALALITQITQLCEAGYSFKALRQEAQEGYKAFHSHLSSLAAEPTEKALHEAVRGAVDDPLLASMVLEAINLAGVEGTVFPEHTKTLVPSVELVNGYRFKISPPTPFYAGKGKWKRQFPKVLIIDGVIERVSEIHGILEKASQTKEPIAFITRGYGEEVIMTLKVNQDRRTLDIIPIIVPFDLEGINMLNDISIVCGADIVTSLKGNLISTIKYDDLKSVDSINCQGNLMTVLNRGTEKHVADHAQFLTRKQEQQHVEDVSDLLLKRIRSLSSYCVRLRIASKSEQEKMKDLEAVDMGLRIVRSVMSHGVIDASAIEHPDDLFGQAWNGVKDKLGQMPVLSVLSAIHHGMSLAMMACSIEKAILKTQ